jgi:hypothetical protein
MAGAIDLSFSSLANLEIFKLDFQSDDPELPVVGECPSSERLNRLSWGSTGGSFGIIAGGLVDGTINIWNPAVLIKYACSFSRFFLGLTLLLGFAIFLLNLICLPGLVKPRIY